MSNTAEEQFNSSDRPHVVMVTNHGMHEWKVDAGLPDTGGQNVYVNQLSATLRKLGFRVTIYNRGGYPHPKSGRPRSGTHYRNGEERLTYLEDSRSEFIRKEEMFPRIGELAEDLARRLRSAPEPVLVVSHYWDGAAVTDQALERLGLSLPHVWIPHSLGALKREGTPKEEWRELRLQERISAEEELLRRVSLIGATSQAMRRTLAEAHGVTEALFLPPCVDEQRFNLQAARDESALGLLSEATGLSEREVREARIITEVSRTDRTKRKDVLIEAFARVHRKHPEALLAVTIDPGAGELYRELTALISERSLSGRVASLGSIWEYLPSLYGMTAVYCTPSIMEGFGMSIQEAAACGAPAVATRRVPFAVEYLRGSATETRPVGEGEENIEVGEGALLVPSESVAATAVALELLLSDDSMRRRMGRRAHEITIPRFTWETMTREFLAEAGIPIPEEGEPGNGS
ncbi:MAG: glycosyltransferase [Alkalispirochaetaceae bacterium]